MGCCAPNQGAFYAYPDFSALPKRDRGTQIDVTQLADAFEQAESPSFLAKPSVLGVGPLSFALGDDDLAEGVAASPSSLVTTDGRPMAVAITDHPESLAGGAVGHRRGVCRRSRHLVGRSSP